MSDASDPPDREHEGENPHDSIAPVRERMRRFLAEHETEAGSERGDHDNGKPLSEIVTEEREERL